MRKKHTLSSLTAARSGFTLLEILGVLVIIAILALALVPQYKRLLANAAQATCMANMRSIHVGLGGYLADHREVWPQGPEAFAGAEWAEFWIRTLEEQGIPQKTWECPAIRRALGNPAREPITENSIHYVPTMFDGLPGTARRWPTQPWLVERANAHGNGALICFTDGSVKPFNQVMAEQGLR